MDFYNFFSINLPYGMEKTDQGWIVFNREYQPLGFNKKVVGIISWYYKEFPDLPISTHYEISNKLLQKLPIDLQIVRNEKGEIIKFWFYNDGNNPCCQLATAEDWNRYITILKSISKCIVKYY